MDHAYPYYKEIAIKHANTTMPNHFRPDYTSWHVVSYNNDGTVECKETFQGKNHDSAWSRGQAWGLYGFTLSYIHTKEERYTPTKVSIGMSPLPSIEEN